MIDPILITLGPYVGVAACVVPLVAVGGVVELLLWLAKQSLRVARTK